MDTSPDRLRRTLRTLALGGCAASVVAGACGSPTEAERLLERTDRAEALWRATRPAGYEAVVFHGCFCPPSVTGPARLVVTVEPGAASSPASETVVTMTYEESGEPVPEDLWDRFPTAEALFEVVRAAVRDRVDALDVEFDPVTGYPREVSIDPDRRTVDEEVYYTFQLVAPPTIH